MTQDLTPSGEEHTFSAIATIIQERRNRALQAVNSQLIELYWEVGKIHEKIERENWGKQVITHLADYLKRTNPNLSGFTRPNLYRMKQFYTTYQDRQIVSSLLRQLPWTHNHIIEP